MNTRLWRETILSVVVILALIVPVAALAAVQPGSSRDSAGAPLSDWVAIEPGATHWYAFHYHFDNSRANIDDRIENDSEDNKENKFRYKRDPETALVVLKAGDESRAVNFVVQTPASLALPKEDSDGNLNGPLGVGSPLVDQDGDVVNWFTYQWAGSAPTKETFFVIVKNSGTSTKTYHLSITGAPVHFHERY